jgi:small subunit ribosomal protein S4
MARYTQPVCKLCRRENQKLFLKGSRCSSAKCALERRAYPPGHRDSGRRRKVSEYGLQLREKQKVRRTYGLLEQQFFLNYLRATSMRGITGENLLSLLERRLDNVVYRLGFAPSRATARQLVHHRHFLVNGKVTNIPSFILRPGDTVVVREKSRKLDIIHSALKDAGPGTDIPWLRLDKVHLEGELLEMPKRADIPTVAQEQQIVELYSK